MLCGFSTGFCGRSSESTLSSVSMKTDNLGVILALKRSVLNAEQPIILSISIDPREPEPAGMFMPFPGILGISIAIKSTPRRLIWPAGYISAEIALNFTKNCEIFGQIWRYIYGRGKCPF